MRSYPALAQLSTDQDQPRTPAPRLADGNIDLGGSGVWECNRDNLMKYDHEGFCLPPGGPRLMGTPYPAEIIQDRGRILVIFEGGGHVWREIHMVGREHPPAAELNPTYFGHSVGHWEGDTLVVDTVGCNEKTWLDFGGHMHSDQLHTVARFSRPFKEVLHYESVIDDPGAYSAPWTVAWFLERAPTSTSIPGNLSRRLGK